MSISELGALGEFIGALLLFVSLIYVAIQLRQNTKALRAESQRSSIDQFTNIDLVIMGNPELREAVLALATEAKFSEMSPDQSIRTNAVLQAYCSTFNRVFQDTRAGVADPSYWKGLESTIQANLIQNSLFQEWWRSRAAQDSLYSGEFYDWISAEVEKVEPQNAGSTQ
jgi:hypothetical protein